jgi:hypothetical protein
LLGLIACENVFGTLGYRGGRGCRYDSRAGRKLRNSLGELHRCILKRLRLSVSKPLRLPVQHRLRKRLSESHARLSVSNSRLSERHRLSIGNTGMRVGKSGLRERNGCSLIR